MRIPGMVPLAFAALTIGASQLRGACFAERLRALLGYFAAGFVSSIFALSFLRGGFDPPSSESSVTEDVNVWGMVYVTGTRFVVPYVTAFFVATALYECVRLAERFMRPREGVTRYPWE